MTHHSNHSSGQKLIFGWLLPIVIGLLGLGTIMAMGKSKPKQVNSEASDLSSRFARLPAVLAEPVRSFDEVKALDIDVTGVVVPFRQVTLAAEVGGRVIFKSEACRIGRFVEAGEVLFKLDSTDYQLEVERLAAMRDSEYAQQKELDQEVANAQRSLELAEQDVALQEKELERLQKLPSGFASATELDQARRLRLTASTQRLNIQNQLEMLESRRTRIQLGERLVATQLTQAKVNLARTEIKAPISGVIVTEMVEQASYIQKGATFCVIHDTQQVEVSCNLRTDQLIHVLDQESSAFPGLPSSKASSESYELPPTPVTVSYRMVGSDDSLLQWEGTLSRYEGIGLNAQSRTVPIRITVEHPRRMKRNGKLIGEDTGGAPPALVQGMFVECAIHTTPKRALVLIPKLALRPGNQVWKFVPDPGILGELSEEKSNIEQGKREVDRNSVDSDSTNKSTIEIDQWTPGRIKVLSHVRSVRLVRLPPDDKEYWIVEATEDFDSNAMLVESPIANLIGDGSDKVRLHNVRDPQIFVETDDSTKDASSTP